MQRKIQTEFKGIVFGGITSTDPIAVYFDGTSGQIYQLSQWVKPLKTLHETLPVTIICRTVAAFNWASHNTTFTTVYCKSIDDLMRLYQQNPFKCILYVNNAYRNFQSLINGRALHVHINHGESDKISTFSNQTKAYDYVLISGPAALEKYDLNLVKKDLNHYIQIGRPQIEQIDPIESPFNSEIEILTDIPGNAGTTRLTVLYAPTWEGTNEEMNYSSVVSLGLTIVTSILNTPGYRLIYRPHPNTGHRLADYRRVNQEITQYVQQNPMGSVQMDCDINALYAHVNIAIFDNSAVAVDYLATNQPMLMTDWLGKTQTRLNQAAMASAARLIGPEHMLQLTQILADDYNQDPIAKHRQWVKTHYLGNFDAAQRESTREFVNAVSRICEECERLNKQLIVKNQQQGNA